MRYTAIYVVRGNALLESKLRDLGLERADFLLEPHVWTNEQGGRSIYAFDDYVSAIKRLFVAHVKLVVLEPSDAVAVFGDLAVSEHIFDRWWSIEAFQGVNTTGAEAIDDLRRLGHVAVLESVGPPLVDRSSSDSKES